MKLEWICFKFPSVKAANNFVGDLSEGYRTRGVNWISAWEQPKRKAGGYAVALLVSDAVPFQMLAGYYQGERMIPKAPASLVAAGEKAMRASLPRIPKWAPPLSL